jgi:hypothetical protein
VSIWAKLKQVFSREAGDLKEMLSDAGKSIDQTLAKKERELAASPEERVDMILEEIEEDDAEFEALEERIRNQVPDDPEPG